MGGEESGGIVREGGRLIEKGWDKTKRGRLTDEGRKMGDCQRW